MKFAEDRPTPRQKRKYLDRRPAMEVVYAPVIILTLNRYEHLKRCISSLQKNGWAKYTPLYISVDFPPASKYEEGYQKICEYLKSGIDGFASVTIFYQRNNLGAYKNELFLIDEVRKQYDRYIFTEDDNEFSPNFIEFIDKGLVLFQEDEDVIAVCAAGSAAPETKQDNVALSVNFAAYGYGSWIKKEDKYRKAICRKYFVEIAHNNSKMFKLAKVSPELLFALQSAILRKERLYQLENGEIPLIDMTMKIYMVLERKYAVASLWRKARNWGYDGSGENCDGENSAYLKNIRVDIDTRDSFDYVYSIPMKKFPFKGKYTIETFCRVIMVFIKLSIWRLKDGT